MNRKIAVGLPHKYVQLTFLLFVEAHAHLAFMLITTPLCQLIFLFQLSTTLSPCIPLNFLIPKYFILTLVCMSSPILGISFDQKGKTYSYNIFYLRKSILLDLSVQSSILRQIPNHPHPPTHPPRGECHSTSTPNV